MKKTILILLFALALVSCAKEVSRREVYREYVPSHTELRLRPMIIGKYVSSIPYYEYIGSHYVVTYEITYDNGKTSKATVTEGWGR